MSKTTKNIKTNRPCHCINFRRAAKIVTDYYDKAFAPMNLTTAQFSLLVNIRYLKLCNKSELAQYVRLDRTTVIRNLNILSRKGLIEEVPGENKRNKLVQLTDLGKDAAEEGIDRWRQVQSNFKQAVGEENIAALKQILENIETLDE